MQFLWLLLYASVLFDGSFQVSVSSSSQSSRAGSSPHMTLEELRAVNHYAESTRSLSYLPQVKI